MLVNEWVSIFFWVKKLFNKFNNLQKKIRKNKIVRMVVAIAAAAIVGPMVAGMVQGSIYASAIAAGVPMGAWASVVSTAGMWGAVAGGAAAGFVAGGIISGSLKGAMLGAVSGAMFGGIKGYYGNTWSVQRVVATANVGGVVSEIQDRKYIDGFKFSGATASMRYLYNKTLGYDATWKSANDLVSGTGYYEEYDSSGKINVPQFGNTIGTNSRLTNDFLGDFFKQGGSLSKVANKIPGMQAVSKIHDYYQIWYDSVLGPGVQDSLLRSVGNIPAMLPAAAITYGGLMNDVSFQVSFATTLRSNRDK